VEEVVDGELGDVGALDDEFEAEGGVECGGDGGERRKPVGDFVCVLEVLFSEGILVLNWIPRLNPMPTAYSSASFSVISNSFPVFL
jgi:hypothetical protein